MHQFLGNEIFEYTIPEINKSPVIKKIGHANSEEEIFELLSKK